MHHKIIDILLILFIISTPNLLAESNSNAQQRTTTYDNSSTQETSPSDSIPLSIEINEITISAVKQGNKLQQEPLSSKVLTMPDIELTRTQSIKRASFQSANIYIPDYGSRITSSIYVRGIGSRIDNPVIGLNIDNVPYLNKNAFDTDIIDIARIEMIRGPQSTLYGRNTMAGVINIYTLSPFAFQGVRLGAEYGNGKSSKLRASVYGRVNNKFAYSFSANHASSDGFFTNQFNGKLLDWEKSIGARIKLLFRPNTKLHIENTAALSLSDQGGYPYENLSTNYINYNAPSAYSRLNFTDGLSLRQTNDWGELNSVTSYSYLADDMRLDQDFTALDYFTLQQASTEHYVSEDLVIKLRPHKEYKALFGTFLLYKNLSMNAPVNFRQYGINQLILKNMNAEIAPYFYAWNEDNFLLSSNFSNHIFGAAIYHESKYTNGRWNLTASLRADFEYSTLSYLSTANSSATLYNKDNNIFAIKDINIRRNGSISLPSLVLLPKVSLQYKLGSEQQSSVYLSVGRGHKVGGFNTQMFSDILQQDVMAEFGVGSSYDVDDIITYKPEYNWTYELGSHIETLNGKISVDISAFFIDIRNQQLTVFPEGETTGRMMTNAGSSRSFGLEASINAEILKGWHANAAYGYTNAKFNKYISGNNNYKGKYIPYAPQHTLHIATNYTLPISSNFSMVFDINANGVGRIYWNEDNSLYQPFYMKLNASINLAYKDIINISLWGDNITNTNHYVFYFKSVGREFVQRGRGICYGLTVNATI